MKKRLIILFVTLFIFGIVYYFISTNLLNIINSIAPKGYVTTRFLKEVEVYLIVCAIVIIIVLLILFFAKYIRDFLKEFFIYINKKQIKIKISSNFIVWICYIYIAVMGIYIINNMDISTDESTYVSTGQNFFDEGKFYYTITNEQHLNPKDMFLQNIFLIPFRNAGLFDVRYLRFITFGFSMVLIYILLKYFTGANEIKRAVLIVLLAASPGFLYLCSSSFAENIAILSLIISILFYVKYNSTKKTYLLYIISFFISLSVLTKLQLGVFTIVALIIMAIYNFYNKEVFRHYIYIIIFTLVIALILQTIFIASYFSPYEIKKLIAIYYTLINSSISRTTSSVNIFINIERLISGNSLILISLIIYAIKRKITGNKEYERFIIIIIVLNAIWYILWKGYNYRFMYYAQFGFILLSVNPIIYLIHKYEGKVKYFIYSILTLTLISGVIQTTKLSITGNSNKYLIAINGNNPYKTFDKLEKDFSQKEFYDKIKETIGEKEKVYYIGAEFETTAHIKNPLYIFTLEKQSEEKEIKYIIRTAINDELGINTIYNDFLENNCEALIKIGGYTLYKIK